MSSLLWALGMLIALLCMVGALALRYAGTRARIALSALTGGGMAVTTLPLAFAPWGNWDAVAFALWGLAWVEAVTLVGLLLRKAPPVVLPPEGPPMPPPGVATWPSEADYLREHFRNARHHT